MSLVKSPKMTEKKVAANRRNRNLSHGPLTEEGRARIRAAHLRHGYYAQAEEVTMRALGEDPAHFQELLEGLWEEFTPTGSLQEGLVIRLARATWLANRADRMQEGYALRQAKDVNIGRDDRLHVQMMRLKMTAESLRWLVQRVAREHYVTTPADLAMMKNLHQEGELTEMGEIALALFYQLQPPGTGENGIPPEEISRRALIRIKAIFGMHGDCPPGPKTGPASPEPPAVPQAAEATEEGDKRYPNITPAEWEARERPRQLLENILRRQAEICEAQRKGVLKESLAGPSPYERAAEIAPTHPDATAMERMEDYNLRQVERITSLLMKIKRQECEMEALERYNEKHGRRLKRCIRK